MTIPRDIEQAFDAYLKAQQLAELKKYILDNPNAKGYLSEKLYSVMGSISFPNGSLIQSEMLLEAGADPNYIHTSNKYNNESILQSLASMKNPILIDLLLKKGAKPDLYVTSNDRDAVQADNATPEKQFVNMFRRKKLPLQIAVKCYHRTEYKNNANIKKCCELLAKATLTEELEQGIIKKLEGQYKTLETAFKNAIQNARRSNKQLIFIVGEEHESTTSLIIEIMLILIAKQNGIETLLTEHTKRIEESIDKDDYYPYRGGSWCVSLPVHQLIKSLNMHTVPIDLGHFGGKKIGEKYDDYEELEKCKAGFDNKSNDGVKYRNEVMRDVIVGGIKQDSLLFVGSAHLYGLLEETPLPDDTINVKAVNAAYFEIKSDLDYNGRDKLTREKLFSLESNQITQANEKNLDLVSGLLSPEIAIDYVRKVHKKFLNENNLLEISRLSLFSNTCSDKKDAPSQSPTLEL